MVVLLIGWTGYQALQARDSLQAVAADFESLAGDLKAGDEAGARASLESAQAAAADARENTRGPGWWLTARLPGVGDDIEAVRTVADVTDRLASDVLPPVVDASEKLDPRKLRPRNGRVALAPIEKIAPSVVRADQHLQAQTDRVAALDVAELNPELAGPVGLMQTKLGEASALSTKAAKAVQLLPSMLGADGKRSYLVLFQNNAEIRSTGGIPGAYAVLTAKNGRLEMTQQGDAAGSLGHFDKPALPLTAEERALFTDRLGTYPQDVNFTPDFPRTAELATAMWEARNPGRRLDGVASADPVALSYLLRGTGPIPLVAGQQLTADNAVQLLLNQIYLVEEDPSVQNGYFAGAARKVFDALAAGQGDAAGVLGGLSRAGSERRLLVWSRHEQEQRLLDDTRLGGALPVEPDTSPFVGVYLNDGTAAKMQYYLDHDVTVKPVSCNPEERQELRVTLTLTSNAPKNAAELPTYLRGAGASVEPGHMRVSTYLYAPTEGWIDTSAVDGEEQPLEEYEHLGHDVGYRTVDIAPGEQRQLTFTVMGGTDQPGPVDLRVTPGAHDTGIEQVRPSACS